MAAIKAQAKFSDQTLQIILVQYSFKLPQSEKNMTLDIVRLIESSLKHSAGSAYINNNQRPIIEYKEMNLCKGDMKKTIGWWP